MVKFVAFLACLLIIAGGCSSSGEIDETATEPTSSSTTTTSEAPAATTTTTAEAPTTTTTTEGPPTTTTTSPAEATPARGLDPDAPWLHFEGAAATDLGRVIGIDVNPDGTTWAITELDVEVDGNGYVLSRFEDNEWVSHPGPILSLEDRAFQGFFGPLGPYVAAGPEGTAWVLDVRWTDEQQLDWGTDLWTYNGEGWDVARDLTPVGEGLDPLIRAIDAGGDGVLWIGRDAVTDGYQVSQPAQFVRFDSGAPYGEWTTYATPPIENCTATCNTPHSDANGTLWTFTASGVARLDGSDWTLLPRDPGFTPPDWQTSANLGIVADDWTMWAILGREAEEEGQPYELTTQIFTDEGWKAWLDPSITPEWTDEAATAQAGYRFLAALGDDHLFVASESGLYWFTADGRAEKLGVAGLGAVEIPALAPAEGSLWIGTAEGISRFNPTAHLAEFPAEGS